MKELGTDSRCTRCCVQVVVRPEDDEIAVNYLGEALWVVSEIPGWMNKLRAVYRGTFSIKCKKNL